MYKTPSLKKELNCEPQALIKNIENCISRNYLHYQELYKESSKQHKKTNSKQTISHFLEYNCLYNKQLYSYSRPPCGGVD